MAKYRQDLPQRHGGSFLTDGGLITTLIFHEGIDLPHLAAFVLLKSERGRERLTKYYESYLAIARRHRVGFVLSSPTWRANPDWAAKLGYDSAALNAINRDSIAFLENLRDTWEATCEPSHLPCVINGSIGPRGDGYKAGRLNADEAEAYHGEQIASFVESGADMVTAFTITSIDEAIGIARAAKRQKMPCAISFTVETDGRLVKGETLRQAIETVDHETSGAPEYFMVNCAHPTHFEQALDRGAGWTRRIYGIRANASTRSHAELNGSEILDDGGDLQDLGCRYRRLRTAFPAMRILGGCCGTDHRHVAAIAAECLPVNMQADDTDGVGRFG